MVVNYVYRLADNKDLEKYQKVLFAYSVSKSWEFASTINLHCNKRFLEQISDLELDLHVIELYDDSSIDYKTFWAASKIQVYNSRPCGEIHLDIDAVIKEPPILTKDDVTVAYWDETSPKPTVFNLPQNYNLPYYINLDTDSFNMSFVFFNNKKLKDRYCHDSLEYIKGNTIQDSTWKSMVWAEQGFLTSIVKNLGYSYNYFNTANSYFHLGAAKNFKSEKDKKELIHTINKKLNGFSNKIFC